MPKKEVDARIRCVVEPITIRIGKKIFKALQTKGLVDPDGEFEDESVYGLLKGFEAEVQEVLSRAEVSIPEGYVDEIGVTDEVVSAMGEPHIRKRGSALSVRFDGSMPLFQRITVLKKEKSMLIRARNSLETPTFSPGPALLELLRQEEKPIVGKHEAVTRPKLM